MTPRKLTVDIMGRRLLLTRELSKDEWLSLLRIIWKVVHYRDMPPSRLDGMLSDASIDDVFMSRP